MKLNRQNGFFFSANPNFTEYTIIVSFHMGDCHIKGRLSDEIDLSNLKIWNLRGVLPKIIIVLEIWELDLRFRNSREKSANLYKTQNQIYDMHVTRDNIILLINTLFILIIYLY